MCYVISYNCCDRNRLVVLKSIEHTFHIEDETYRDGACDRYKKWIGKQGRILATSTRFPNSYLVDFGKNMTFWVGKEDIDFLDYK